MDVKERILQCLDELIEEAEFTARALDRSAHDDRPWDAWHVSALPFVAQLTGRKSTYYQRFAEHAKDGIAFSTRRAAAILQRIRNDYAKGYLRDLRELVAAEVFTDFLDMADYLHANVNHIPAASVTGAVLEDCLRRLHLKHVGPWQGDSSISKLNDGLRRAGVYEQAVWRQVQAWGDIRNEADHGHFEKVNPGQVKSMIQGVRDFIAKYEE